jgi:protein SCO1/2
MTTTSSRVVLVLSAFLAGLVVFLGVILFIVERSPDKGLSSTIGGPFSLVDQDGKPITDADFKGKPFLVFFGYTHCPDVCPTTLAELASAMKKLGTAADKVQVLLITVDPERDTPDVLGPYVTAFDPRFLALRGDANQTAQVAREFKVIYQKVGGKAPDNYTMDHSAGTYIFDPQGRLRLYVGYGQGSEVFAHDIGRLLAAGP